MNQPSNTDDHYDLCIIGGGINGAGIAADAAGRGLRVLLCDQHDLGSATSWTSSKLIHGGLRYLEQYQFRLVREALSEREILLNKAPHLIRPQSFLLPHSPNLRPKWMIKLGLFLYDHLAGRSILPSSKTVHIPQHLPDNPLQCQFKQGFVYSDCTVDDSRLVILNAIQAQQKGATILPRWHCIHGLRHEDKKYWQLNLEQVGGPEKKTVFCKALINATGPWAQTFIESVLTQPSPRSIRWIKGSHLLTQNTNNLTDALILQTDDQRVVFVTPYLNDFLLIGTTDIPHQGNLNSIRVSQEEINYLLSTYNQYFTQPIFANDIISQFAGVRPLCSDESHAPSAITRDYTLEIQRNKHNSQALLSVFGGKLTTYRKLAESALELLKTDFPEMGKPWTQRASLPGGDFPYTSLEEMRCSFNSQFPWLDPQICKRVTSSYGTIAENIFRDTHQEEDLGINFGAGLYQKEVDYLIEQEWAMCSKDVIWRRTKLAYQLNKEQILCLERYISEKTNLAANASQFSESHPTTLSKAPSAIKLASSHRANTPHSPS